MKNNSISLLPLFILSPYIFSLSPSDSSFNEYSFGVGAGQYASYDCADRAHQESFKDAGVKVSHKFEGPYRIGVSTTVATANDRTKVLPYPDLALEYPTFSVGTTGMRIGREDALHAELSVADQVPFFSGKGFGRLGLGWKSQEHNTRFWVGINAFPYHQAAVAGQVDFPIAKDKFLFVNGRYGKSGGVPEYGLSAGVRIRSY